MKRDDGDALDLTFLGVTGVLLAALVPARRASSVDPLEALRAP